MSVPKGPLDGLSPEDKRQLLRDLIRRDDGRSLAPASVGQRALWFLHRLDPNTAAYNVVSRWRLPAAVDAAALPRALRRLAERHAALRTTFVQIDGDVFQRITSDPEVPFRHLDARGWADATLDARLAADAERPFDLEQGPVFRVALVSRADADHLLQLTCHHVAYDHWSLELLIRDLRRLYASETGGGSKSLPPVSVRYAEYVRWQTDLLAGPVGAGLRAFWEDRLQGELPVLDLPTDRPRPAAQTYRGDSYLLPFPAELSRQLAGIARRAGTTPYTVLLSAFVALLYRYTGQDDLLVGTPTSGRTRAEFADVVGYFVNPVVIRSAVSGGMTFLRLVEHVRGTVLGAMEHGDFPFPALVESLQPVRDPSRSPLFQVAFTWDKFTDEDHTAGEGLPLQFLMGTQLGSNFDLDLIVLERAGALEARWRYSSDLFDAETIARMAGHYVRLLEGAAADPMRRIADLPLNSAADRGALLFGCNPAAPEGAAPPTTLVEWFDAQSARTPDGVAAVCGGETMTYRELSERSNQLAHHLRACGASAESRVALCLERSLSLVVAIVGILKAGAAYLPIDPDSPADRIRFIVGDAGASLAVTDRTLEERFDESVRLVRLDADEAALRKCPTVGPDLALTPDALAYVIYTSGSTGHPKGVGVSHANVTRLFASTEPWFRFGPDDVWTLFHSAAFDFSVWELWGALLYGGRVVVVPYWVSRSPEPFRALVEQERVTVLNQTPSAFRQFMAADAARGGEGLALRHVIFGGEALDPAALRPWIDRHGASAPRLVNMYGITETTVHVTCRPLTPVDIAEARGSVIGGPIPDLAVYVLDDRLEPAPIGVRGEVYVGGAGVSRGYLGRPRLTAERFIPDPFGTRPGGRLYRSGDLARRLPNGDLEYLGRADQQVKVRGFRIETGEIEHAAARHPGVRQAVVVPGKEPDGTACLIAYVVPDPEAAGPVRRLIAWERDGRLANRSWCELPNGLAVVQLNRNETDFLFQEIFGDGQYLRHGIALGPGACVFDVGANIGMFSLYAAEQCRGEVTIHAFEPIPPVADLLRLNAELHGLDIRVMAAGLSSAPGEEDFTFYRNVSIFSGRFGDPERERAIVERFLRNQQGEAAASAELLDELLGDRLAAETVRCPLTTVSAAIAANRIERIDLLKVDVEKSELAVLEGVEAADWPKIRQVIVEVHDEHGRLAAVRRLLEAQGFQVAVEQSASLAGTGLFSVYAVREPARHEPRSPRTATWSSPARFVADLRRSLEQTLPDYMVPSAFVLLDQVPLTGNGKLDRRALPAAAPSRRAVVAPRTPLETQIAGIWRDVLQIDAFGVHDDFFDLGGHSLLATKVIARLRAATSIDVPLRSLFDAPTIEGLALAMVQQQLTGVDPDAFRQALADVENS
jgi:amino acid adenylation domain-containing protein/FkbM family methyltransferase